MKPGHLNVDALTRQLLDEDGVQKVAAVLHPRRGDCQTCNTTLTAGHVSLAVDMVSDSLAIAALHHDTCRRAAWNSSGFMIFHEQACSYATGYWGMPAVAGNARFPLLMVNPALEAVHLAYDAGRWSPAPSQEYLRLGFRPHRDGHPVASLPDDVKIMVYPGGLVQIAVSAQECYPPQDGDLSPAPQGLLELLRPRHAALLAISHAADPGDIRTVDQALAMFQDPITVSGMAAVVHC